MKNLSRLVGSLFCISLLGLGCSAPASRPQPASPTSPPTVPTVSQTGFSSYQPFTKTAYEQAKQDGNPIFLFFYANWCPTCREQDPRLQKVVPSHTGGVVGLRVNYNDLATDDDEKALAKEFGVTYQHTGFFIGRDGETKKKTIGSISDAQTLEYLDLISK